MIISKGFFSSMIFLILSTMSMGQGIDFFHGTWEEALVKAKAEEKLIFVDAYAVWCGPCKRMARNVFTDKTVGAYYNDHFINLKIDMEKEPGREFGQKFPVSAFPTLFYIDEKGEVLKKLVGGRDVEEFLAIGKAVAGSYDRSGDLAQLYEAGDRSYDLVLKYIHALNNANKPSLKISNDFLRSNPNLNEKERANFLFEALTAADSRIFDLFVADLKAIRKVKGDLLVDKKIEEACWNSIQTAVAFESKELVEETKTKMQLVLGDKDHAFAYNADYEFAKATADMPLLKSASINIAKRLASNDPERLHDLCNEILQYRNLDITITETSEKLAKMAADKGKSPMYLMTYAKILANNNKTKKAVKAAKKALSISEPGSQEAQAIQDWIDSLKA